MPCYRCRARQSDPAGGPNAWKRGVRAGRQVLVCPDCQLGRDWTAELDSCSSCRSTMLQKSLGETTCRACGFVGAGSGAMGSDAGASAGMSELADDVAAAIARILSRGVH